MSATPPLAFVWTGEAMVPTHPSIAGKHFALDEIYRLVEHNDRSQKSHSHYFAALHEGWQNLPEHIAERFPTDEHLRKYALIKAGYHDSQSITCASKAEAVRVAAFIRPADEFSVVTVTEATVTRYAAKSQKLRAMGRDVFQKSKSDVLDVIAALVGVKSDQLKREATRAA